MKRIATLYDQSTELKHPEPSTGDDVPETPFPDVLDAIKPKIQSINEWNQLRNEIKLEKRKRGRPRKA
jgi:hypothetical protein